MHEPYQTIWRELTSVLKLHLSAEAFDRWFGPLELLHVDEMGLTFQVPNSIYQLWIESNYLDVVRSAAISVLGSPREIKFLTRDGGMMRTVSDPQPDRREAPASPPQDEEPEERPDHGMNPRHSFAGFVVGSNNQFAHAAALAVSQSPAKTYNPLFIYGGVGLGKTHLMQAIGQQTIERKKTRKVMYLSSERFTNEFIDSIQHQKLVRFRKRFVRQMFS